LDRITNYLTIDVEDYYHVSAFETISPPDTWAKRESRVERNTDLVLSILDEASVKATFFVLGWVADRIPTLVPKIAARGHEIASHGYLHQRVGLQDRTAYREDVCRSKKLLEDQSGVEVSGYRAPSYSITRKTDWAFDELLAAGYRYDSSIFPFQHDFYGIPDWPRFAGYAVKSPGNWQAKDQADDGAVVMKELPITTLSLCGKNFPIAGGGYFRLLPYAVTRWGLSRINQKEKQPFVFYLHPWEFDPDQPRMGGCSAKSKFRHYLNLSRTDIRFRQLLKDFKFGRIADTLLSNSQ